MQITSSKPKDDNVCSSQKLHTVIYSRFRYDVIGLSCKTKRSVVSAYQGRPFILWNVYANIESDAVILHANATSGVRDHYKWIW